MKLCAHFGKMKVLLNTLTVNVVRIRKKLAEIGLSEFIKTKKGQGYMIE